MRYTLTEAEQGGVWGACAEAEGFFGDAARGTYELFGWAGEGPAVTGWAGSRVWLVPEDAARGPWLLEDAACAGRFGASSLVLSGLDDYEGPPEWHDGGVRVHDGRRWLGSCRVFTRVLPAASAARPLVLRGFDPSARLRAALESGTRRALDLGESVLRVRDDRGGPLTDRLLHASVTAWRPSLHGADLIDLELDGRRLAPLPEYARPVWDRWFAGPPAAPAAWAGLGTRLRGAWLDIVRERPRSAPTDRPAGYAYELDGRHITDEPGLHLALGEAVNGPGGYFGGGPAALADCLRGTFGCTTPATLLWRDAETARRHLSEALEPDGGPRDLFAEVLDVLAEGGMAVTLA